MAKKNPIIHFEWRTRDTGRLTKFYGALFDWKFKEMGPDYTGVETGNKEGGGESGIRAGSGRAGEQFFTVDVADRHDFSRNTMKSVREQISFLLPPRHGFHLAQSPHHGWAGATSTRN